jgi:putative ABC transport system permease protein
MYSVLDAMIHPRIDVRRPQDIHIIQLYGDVKHQELLSSAQRDSMLASGLDNVESSTWFNQIGSYMSRGMVFESGNNVAEGNIRPVSAAYFDLITPRVVAGRTFIPADSEATLKPIVLGEAMANQLFPNGANPVGSTIKFADSAYVVIGVVSRYSDFPEWRTSAWTLGRNPEYRYLYTRMIRLRPGASVENAAKELKFITNRIAQMTGEDPKYVEFRFFHVSSPQFQARGFHYAIVLAVVAVLLVACANLANMQLARGIGRQRELALRSALGASRRRIIQHLLTESVLLSLAGLVLGLVLTYWGGVLVKHTVPPTIGDYAIEPRLSWRVLVFALTATVACIFLVGVAPSVRVSRVDPNEMLKSGAGTGATRRHRRQYGYLVAAEIALALGLLSGSALMVRSAIRASENLFAYDPMQLVTAYVGDRTAAPVTRPQSEVFASAIARAEALPEVRSAAGSERMSPINSAVTVSDSARGVREILAPMYGYLSVSPNYLRTMGLPIVRGRDFLDGERDEAAVIIDEFTAASLWPAANPIGALIKFGDMKSSAPYARVVGVTKTLFRRLPGSLRTNEIKLGSVYYLPGPRDSTTWGGPKTRFTQLTLRAAGDPAKLPIVLRRARMTAPAWMGESVLRQRANITFVARMFTLFAMLGLGLAAFGVYGVVAHSVAERRRELGVRIALGASGRDILHAVLRESVVIGLAGVALGLLGTKYGVPLLAQFAFEDDLFNAPLFAAAAVFLFGVAAAAAYLPALRATRIDPTQALRCE